MNNNSTNVNNLVVGLDIGTTKIATVVGYRNENGQIEVIGHGLGDSTGVEFGEIKNLNHTVEGILHSKDIASQRTNFEIEEAYVGIAGHHIKTSKYNRYIHRDGNRNPISQEEIDNAKKDVFEVEVAPGEKIIDVIPQRYIIDDERETPEPVGELGNKIIATYQLITGKDKEIQKIFDCCHNANLEINDVILEPIASGLACLSEEEKKQGCVLVDIGGGTTDMIIYIDGSPVYTKVISLGGNIITKDIAQVCKISEDVAEQLKIKHGTCIVDKSNANNFITISSRYGQEPIQISENYLAQIINCRVQEEILNSIKKEIENSGYKDRLYAGLILTGGGANLRHIKELCQYTLQLNTRIGVPDNGFSRTLSSDLKQPMFSTALGLLKYGIEAEEYNMSRPLDEEESEGNGMLGGIFGGKKENKKTEKKPENQHRVPDGGGREKWGFFSKVYDWLKTSLEKFS
ncbi:MAG: cell division protein FtsA [Bacteroidales bacterium]|nr:cell division protein FtsA [Bacteroidales bacterium]